MIEAKQVQDRSVNIVDVRFSFDGIQTELVGRAVDVTWLYTATGHPHCEAEWIMIAAVTAFTHWRTTEFASPDN